MTAKGGDQGREREVRVTTKNAVGIDRDPVIAKEDQDREIENTGEIGMLRKIIFCICFHLLHFNFFMSKKIEKNNDKFIFINDL